MYPHGEYTRVPTIKGPERDPLGHRKGTCGTPPGSPTSQVRIPQAPARVPGGSWQGPRRAPAGQIMGLNRGIFLAGARVTFKLELKVTRGPRGGEKMDGTRPGSLRSHAIRPKTTEHSPAIARKGPFCELWPGHYTAQELTWADIKWSTVKYSTQIITTALVIKGRIIDGHGK